MRVRSITLRLALTYTVTFAVAIAILGIAPAVSAQQTPAKPVITPLPQLGT